LKYDLLWSSFTKIESRKSITNRIHKGIRQATTFGKMRLIFEKYVPSLSNVSVDQIRNEVSKNKNVRGDEKTIAEKLSVPITTVIRNYDAFKKTYEELRKKEKATESSFFLKTDSNPAVTGYLDDPQKGKWGGSAQMNDRTMSASVKHLLGPFYEVEIQIISTNDTKPLTGKAKFHLHDTFLYPEVEVDVNDNGQAILKLRAYGAFTVGAEVDEGKTKLELDLALLPDAPKEFRER
jgi:hypothetical protein